MCPPWGNRWTWRSQILRFQGKPDWYTKAGSHFPGAEACPFLSGIWSGKSEDRASQSCAPNQGRATVDGFCSGKIGTG